MEIFPFHQVLDKPLGEVIRIREEEIMLIATDIPHCKKHQHGVIFAMDTSYERNGWALRFCSYAYRNEFRHMNNWANRTFSK